MRRRATQAVGGLALLVALAIITLSLVARALSPFWFVISALLLIAGAIVLGFSLYSGQTVPGKLPRIFWLGLGLVLGGLLVAQPWFTVTTFKYPVRIDVEMVGYGPPTSLQRATLPASIDHELRLAFPRFRSGEAWQVVGGDTPTYEIWLRQRVGSGFALQVLATGGQLQIEDEQQNTLYTGSRGQEIPLRRLKAMFKDGRGVLGPYVFPGYLLYVAPHVAQYRTVDRYTASLAGGGGW